MPTLKQILDQIWNDSTVRCPRHLVWWNTDHGYQVSVNFDGLPLFYAKGTRVDLKGKAAARVGSDGSRS